jgi:hypothetical protein
MMDMKYMPRPARVKEEDMMVDGTVKIPIPMVARPRLPRPRVLVDTRVDGMVTLMRPRLARLARVLVDTRVSGMVTLMRPRLARPARVVDPTRVNGVVTMRPRLARPTRVLVDTRADGMVTLMPMTPRLARPGRAVDGKVDGMVPPMVAMTPRLARPARVMDMMDTKEDGVMVDTGGSFGHNKYYAMPTFSLEERHTSFHPFKIFHKPNME